MFPFHQIKSRDRGKESKFSDVDGWPRGDEGPLCPESSPTPRGRNLVMPRNTVAIQGRLLLLPNELIISCQKNHKAIKCQVHFLKHIIFIAAGSD